MRKVLISIVLTTFATVLGWPVFAEWPAELNTAKNAIFLNDLEREVIHELNKVRSNPQRFADEYMEELRACFNGRIFTYPGQDPVKTSEGISPLNECLQELRKAKPLPILSPAEGLARAAADLAADQQKKRRHRPYRKKWIDTTETH